MTRRIDRDRDEELDRPTGDPLVDEQTRAAREEVDALAYRPGAGGEPPVDPAQVALREGGSGEAEGFELAEEQLIENAEHGRSLRDPGADAFAPEAEADDVAHGEADRERSSAAADERG